MFDFMNEVELVYKYMFVFRQKRLAQQAKISFVDKILDYVDIVIGVLFEKKHLIL